MTKKRSKPRPKVQRTCNQCGDAFSATQSDVDRGGGNFCGRKCFHSFKRKSLSVLRLCKMCDKEFSVYPSRVANGSGVCCSKKCHSEHKKITNKQVSRNCKACGAKFLAYQGEVDRGGAKFCSKKCYVTYKLTNNAMVQVECKTCGKAMKMYQVQADTRRFCSWQCSAESRRNTVTCECQLCGKKFESWKSATRKFCSRTCSSNGQGHKQGPPANRVICQTCGKVFLVEAFNKDRKFCTHKCATDSFRKSDIQKARRRGKEHQQWALAVMKRDKKCVRCGVIENLQAHHVKHWKKCPEKRFDVENGATLCVYCHHAQHPNIPLKNFIAVGGVSVRYCVVCESAYVSRSKDQRACSRKCGARLTADKRLSKKECKQ